MGSALAARLRVASQASSAVCVAEQLFRAGLVDDCHLVAHQVDELVGELQSPLFLLWGIRDPWINAPGRRASFQRHSPENTHEVVLEAGHCPHDEVPDQVNQALLDWLGSLDNQPTKTLQLN